MKPLSSFLPTVLASVLVLVLLRFAPPITPAYASASASHLAPADALTATVQSPLPVQPVCDSKRSIQVSGTAVINVAPDRALIQLGVQSNGETVRQVEAANSASTQAVIKAAHALGVDGKDITTDWYVIEPIYDDHDSLYIKGYRIHNIVAITLRDVSKTSPVIAAALQAGANQVINVDFYTSELRKYRDQAREMAMKAAREKAQALANAAGAEAGCVLTINENSWSSYNGWWYGRSQNQNQWTQNVVQNIEPSAGASSATDDEPISLGQISVKAEINASFSLQ